MRKLKLHELGRKSPEDFRRSPKHPVVLVLDNIRSALNVGSIFRTADAFAVERIVLTGITATPPHREILKTAIGASETVPWSYAKDVLNAVETLQDEGYHIHIIEQTDRSIPLADAFTRDDRIVLIIGNEVTGVSDSVIEKFSNSIEIPQYGTKHSINVAVTVGIVLWEFIRGQNAL